MKHIFALFTILLISGCIMNEAPTAGSENTQNIEVIASELSIPWDLAFVSEDEILVTERTGNVLSIINNEKRIVKEFAISDSGEAGLLGIELHPQFGANHYVYLYLTTLDGQNRILRYTYTNNQLRNETVVFANIPGARYHDGGRIRFGPDRYLYVTVGDATEDEKAQDPSSLHGTILRIDDNGNPAPDNPFGTAVYSYGHRNPQGLAWHGEQLWSTEHGRSGIQTGMDEVNLIIAGGNYGWPEIEGDETRKDMISPVAHSGPDTTWAPASAAVIGDTLYFGGLRGAGLYAAQIMGEDISPPQKVLEEYGRIRTVIAGPDNSLYITTSNTDGRGQPADGDDKILRIDSNFFLQTE